MSDGQFKDKTPINSEGAECPYCGSVYGDMWESSPGDGDTEIIECECGKSFESTTCITVDYQTKPIECSEGHQYSDDDWSSWFKVGDDTWDSDESRPNLHHAHRDCMNCDDGNEWRHKDIEPCTEDSHEWSEWCEWKIVKDIMNCEETEVLIRAERGEIHRFRHCTVHACNDRGSSGMEIKNVSQEEWLGIRNG